MDHQGEKQTMQPRPDMYYEEEINLRDLLLVLWRYRTLILGIFLAAVVTAAVLSFVLPPVYEVKAKMSLGYLSPAGTNPVHPLYTSPKFAKEMFLSEDFIREAVRDIKRDMTPEQFTALKESLKVEAAQDTNLVTLSIETKNPQEGRAILNRMVAIYSSRSAEQFDRQQKLIMDELKRLNADLANLDRNIESLKATLANFPNGSDAATDLRQVRLLDSLSRFEGMRQELLERKVARQQELNGIERLQVIQSPVIPDKPVRPRKKLNIAVAGVLGLMVGVFAAFTLDYFRRNPLNSSETCA